jgi:hypothetical protein
MIEAAIRQRAPFAPPVAVIVNARDEPRICRQLADVFGFHVVANGSTFTRAMLWSRGPADKPFAQPDHHLRRDFVSIIYNHRPGTHDVSAFGETTMPQVSQTAGKNKSYGR